MRKEDELDGISLAWCGICLLLTLCRYFDAANSKENEMGFDFNPTEDVSVQALRLHAKRLEMLASNL